jgi:hypothetical protein
MRFVFCDDSQQKTPTRPGMGNLVATGGIEVVAEHLGVVERELDVLCTDGYGFPKNEEFKWSPNRKHWMWANLQGQQRSQFFADALQIASSHDVSACVVIVDASYEPATGSGLTPELDATRLFLERVDWRLRKSQEEGVVVTDRPSGGRRDEDQFLGGCIETLQDGTDYVKPDRVAVNVLSTPSRFVRLLQLADVVTSSVLAFVSGEGTYSPATVKLVRPLLHSDSGRIGGVGLKIHPDLKYVNLYHWLVGDSHYWRSNTGHPLPISGMPYTKGPHQA